MVSGRFSPIRLAAVVLIAALPLSIFAKDVGRPAGGGSAIEWQTVITGHEKIQLTVVDPNGEVFVKEFTAGRNPSFRVTDLGGVAADGAYTYEMRVVPKVSSNVKKQLENARANNDEAAAKKIMRDNGLGEAVTQSGTFTVINGSIVDPNAAEPGAASGATRKITTDATSVSGGRNWTPTTLDNVIADDLIVQGSACVGLDCVNGESFGFDTIRLKENNTRIKFDDTSASAGFPANDWQLTANDSASGGASKFSIEDITGSKVPVTVTAGASTNSLFIDSTGRIGFRTSTPVLDLHVTTSNTPALRLEQTNAGGFTAQTWDVAGNEANFFVRDVTGGSRLPFRIRPGAPTSSIDIAADGDVGFGTASPNANTKVDINDSTQLKARIALTGQEFFAASNTDTEGLAILLGVNRTSNRQMWIGDTAALTQNTTNKVLRFVPGSGEISAIATDGVTTKPLLLNSQGGFVGIARTTASQPLQVGTANTNGNGAHVTVDGVWTNGSSRTFKENIHELSANDAMAAIAALTPVTYNYHTSKEPYVGFIAEDVPKLVAQEYDRRYLSPMDIVATLTKVVQEQQKTIEQLSKKVDALEHK